MSNDTLARIVGKNDRIFIDTCSFLEYNIEDFLEELNDCVEGCPNAVYTYVHQKVREELEKHRKGSDPDLTQRAAKALRLIKLYEYNHLLTRLGQVGDKYADAPIYNAINEARQYKTVLLITEDKKLESDVLGLNNLQSQRGYRVMTYSLRRQFKKSPQNKSSKTTARKLNESLIYTPIPQSGDTVCANSGKYILGAQIGNEGGEGSCYHVGNGLVCKIFKREKLTVWRREKLEYMVSNPINHSGKHSSICWPQELVTNGRGAFVGYIMPEAVGKPLHYIISDVSDKKRFVKNKHQLVEICRSLANAFHSLHENHVIMGDVSPSNILFDNGRITLIDMDSVQVGGFPCKMFTEGFVAPEHIKDDKSTVVIPEIRDPQNEVINVANLLFQVLVGINPFFRADEQDESLYANYGEEFPYPLATYYDGGDYSRVPQGLCRYEWDHLFAPLKTAFTSTFKAGGKRHDVGNRYEMAEWIRMLKWYIQYLETLPEKDERNNVVIRRWCSKAEIAEVSAYTGFNLYDSNAAAKGNKPVSKPAQKPSPKPAQKPASRAESQSKTQKYAAQIEKLKEIDGELTKRIAADHWNDRAAVGEVLSLLRRQKIAIEQLKAEKVNLPTLKYFNVDGWIQKYESRHKYLAKKNTLVKIDNQLDGLLQKSIWEMTDDECKEVISHCKMQKNQIDISGIEVNFLKRPRLDEYIEKCTCRREQLQAQQKQSQQKQKQPQIQQKQKQQPPQQKTETVTADATAIRLADAVYKAAEKIGYYLSEDALDDIVDDLKEKGKATSGKLTVTRTRNLGVLQSVHVKCKRKIKK